MDSKILRFNLPNESKISTLDFENEEDWLELRTKGIGGSDIGAILGINKYTTPLDIYRQKVEGYRPDMSDNVYIKKGKDLEDLILTNYVAPYFMRQFNMNVCKPDFMMINEDFPWIRANVDGIAYNRHFMNKPMIIEIKWVSEYAEENWRGSEYCGVPPSYYAQVQLYMAVTGCEEAYVCALFDKSWNVEYFKVPRDDTFIANLIKVSNKFYHVHMCTKIPPLAEYSRDKEASVDIIKDNVAPTIASEAMTVLANQYLDVNDKLKQLEAVKSKISNKLFEGYQQGFYPDNPSIKFNMSTVTSKRFNANKFKVDHEDMYEEYCEESSYSKMNVKDTSKKK